MKYEQDIKQRERIERAIHAVEEKTGKHFKKPPTITNGEGVEACMSISMKVTFQTDESLENLTDEELEGIVAHELGHTFQTVGVISSALAMLGGLLSGAIALAQVVWLTDDVNPERDLGKAVLTGLFSTVSFLAAGVINRTMERGAEKFAAEAGYAEARTSRLKRAYQPKELTPQHGDWLKEICSGHPLPYKTISWLEDYIKEQEKQQSDELTR